MIQRLVDIRTDATAAFEKESKRLLVRWTNDMLLFALVDNATGSWQAAEIIKYENGDAENFITELKQKSTLANYTGLQTQVFVTTPQAMVIPKQLESHADLFLKTQFGSEEAVELFIRVANETVTVAFRVKQKQLVTIQKLFPQAIIKSSLGALVNQALREATEETTVLLLNVSKTVVELVLIQKGQLLLARCFSFTANEDVLYHLLNACRVFDISPQAVEVLLQGQIQEQDAIYLLLQTYFANLHFAKAAAALQHPAFLQVAPHYFTPLI